MSNELRPEKFGQYARIPLEDAAMIAGGDWARRIDYVEEIPPAREDWEDYYEAVALRDKLDAHPSVYFVEVEFEEPGPERIVHFAETHEEWMDRVKAKLDAGEEMKREPLISFNQAIVDAYFGKEGA